MGSTYVVQATPIEHMKKFNVEILDRSYTKLDTGRLDFAPLNWEAAAIGGPTLASIDVTGAEEALWVATGWLGHHVRILNEAGTIVWWGFINAVQVMTSGASVNIAIDDMRNRINVDYTYTDNDGAPIDDETGWAEDIPSVTRYGPWEERVTLADTTPDIAAQKRDTWLAQTALPVPSIEWRGGNRGMRIDCVGYWSLMGNVYYANGAGRIVYDEPINMEHMLGWLLTDDWAIGWNHKIGGFRIHDINSRFYDVTVGTQLDVSGSLYNNRSWTVTGVPVKPDSDQVIYQASMYFASADEIFDDTFGYEIFTAGEMIHVSGTNNGAGTADNNGYWFIQGFDNPGDMEVGSNFGRFVADSPAELVTMIQGHSVQIEESPNDENPGATFTTLASRGVRVAQSFVSAGTWTAHEVMVQVKKIGAPTQPLLVRLYSDVAGTPTTVLAFGTIAAADVRTVLEWVTVDFGTPYQLQAATTYWIAVSGGATGLDCYTVGLTDDEDAQYVGGACKIQILAGSWETRWGELTSMPFQLWGKSYTSTQVQAMASVAMPDFQSIVRTASGTIQRFYRDGQSRASSEAQTLIDTGDGAGNRISVRVSHDRIVYIGVEPTIEGSDAGLCVHYDVLTGKLRNPGGGLVEEGMLPDGQIVYMDNVETAGTTLSNVRRVFVEAASYDADNDRLSMESKGRLSPWELL